MPLAQELEQVQVLVGQMPHHESLSWDVEPRTPHEGMEHPACGRVLDALALWVRQGCSVLLQGRADALFESRLDEPSPRHHHQEGHHALGLFALEGGG
jgi:hypothetical protein